MTDSRRLPASRRPRTQPTEDRKLLQQRPHADTSSFETEGWRALRIMSEFVEGFDALARIGPAVSVFGSARVPEDDPMYGQAQELGRQLGNQGLAVITGGGPGIMEAANRGALESDSLSVGLAIELPHEQDANAYCDLLITFRYFFVRKMMFVKYAQAFVIFPGGFGTLDELFEAVTLVQTAKIEHFPTILFGSQYWSGLVEWCRDVLLPEGKISHDDFELLHVTDDVDETCALIRDSVRAQQQAITEDLETLGGREPAEAQREREAQRTRNPS